MPILNVIISSEKLPSKAAMAEFVARAAQICQTTLNADADKIQIQLLSTMTSSHGRDIYLELRYRESAKRDASVMSRYMEQMEEAVESLLGLSHPRIRCFPQKSEQLFARN